MRVTIKPHLKHYFGLLQQQMECDNPSEVLNYLLMDLALEFSDIDKAFRQLEIKYQSLLNTRKFFNNG